MDIIITWAWRKWLKCNFRRPIFYRAVKIMYCRLWLIVDVYLIFLSIPYFDSTNPLGNVLHNDCEKGTVCKSSKGKKKRKIKYFSCSVSLFLLWTVFSRNYIFFSASFLLSDSIVLFKLIFGLRHVAIIACITTLTF